MARPSIMEFDAVRDWFRRRYHKARDAKRRWSHYDRPRCVLKREIYRYVIALQRAGAIDKLRAHIVAQQGARGIAGDNDFLWGLRLAAPKSVLTNEVRSNWAREMLYAARHDIHWTMLDFFLAGVGSNNLIKDRLAKKKYREKWAAPLTYAAIRGQGDTRAEKASADPAETPPPSQPANSEG